MNEYISAINVPQKGICLIKDAEMRVAVSELSVMLSGELSVQCMSAEYERPSECLVFSQYVSCYPHVGGGDGGGGGETGNSRYALETAQLVADGGSLTCAVNDQAITTIRVSSSSTPVVVQLPAQPEDGARDFILRIEISSSSAPTFTFSGVNETIDFDSEDDDWAVMEPGLNLVSFTETKRGDGSSSGNSGGGSTVVYHTVTFEPQQSLVNQSEATRQVADGQPVGTLPATTRDGIDLLGWFNGTGTQVTSSTIITADVIFYAYYSSGGSVN